MTPLTQHPQDVAQLRADIAHPHPHPGHDYRLRRATAPPERWIVLVDTAGDTTGAGDSQIGGC